ncbi:MAG: endonuclease III [Oscillospiraceae bacterium]|nr:endonuclease III [Oscillospiraceae bacterium]
MNKKERVCVAISELKKIYPEAVCSLNYSKPYELLIATRLSAQCTDARVNIVTKELFKKYPTLQSFADADLEELESYVRPCGFYRTKAKSIKEMAISIISDFGGEVPDTMEKLTSLSGVGRKTANLILGDVYGKPAVVTDTHCIRITGRLGFTDNTEPRKVEKDLREIIPPEEGSDFCHRLVNFGREICKARNPMCDICTLKNICRFYKENYGIENEEGK